MQWTPSGDRNLQPMSDEYYMGLALDMARHTQGQTGINPVVGSVVVRDGAVVGMGAHLKRGEGHAEVQALQMAGERAEGSTVYVTLEPCSHYGATPPCSKRLIEAGVSRVVVACEDPNPQVSGRGIAMLKEAGITVETGVMAEEARQLNKKFIKFITTGLPFVTLKTASTLDGKIATRTGDSKWVTGEAARQLVHTMRHQHAAILVGVNTVIADDPSLTTRLPVPGLSPIRVIVDSKLRIPDDARVLKPVVYGDPETILLTTMNHGNVEKQLLLESKGIRVIPCGGGERVDLHEGLKQLALSGISSVLVEGGGTIGGAFLAEKLVDEVQLFLAPKLLGSGGIDSFGFAGPSRMKEAIALTNLQITPAGKDLLLTGTPSWEG
ncbi:bifunctional diaminohydroxyphosphoribosylaminopyrimidine deaminase/5-amino-6-(5-phosphoribosylamino)uracil reductase [Paenibacillus yonginensis]|uniref:Riboflavin biosynthesis protein RibD n=1 Tax=Paenibacillus yonginensis TaxID=1462996 RepID=A0A1B1N0D5_9BACL|nr:bifunctional diaminohydroxyphosphoribosylaminopyrimidine deaminase/5-amino-6-(5-phosphoribosylamino)uracil reductase RibD [Paenibacillus yonginensis]ANS74900.1 bifunctional diaminohydroxyphosphoribosylaminopyrimidine deaminase/5-amino-6-(5-phosphoribosylamino)uracil reductase [Paenibacillus yonginensis]